MHIRLLNGKPHPPQEVGYKAAALNELMAHHILIPRAFVVTTTLYHQFLQENGLDFPQPITPQEITQGRFSPSLQAVISQALQDFSPDARLAVRSSSLFEDTKEASFAGQYATVLGVSQAGVFDAIKHCWSSVPQEHVKAYAMRQGISLETGSMAVIVQALVHADVSGVSFSVHPVTGDNRVVINASYGLGEVIVDGTVTPDVFEIDKDTGSVSQHMGFKECWMQLNPEGGTEIRDTPLDRQSCFCLTSHEIQAIYQLTCTLEQMARCPIDVEWAIADRVLYCLQMRPISTPQF
ncbi:PEP/pyruvate-binding domain-containing protein [Sulfobacillus thermosulfidooxidans]|uniref:PEP/pyruvate-binding domain-containing protein n=1 Tax=Sulfobacillus thermosulfidooxidans TaxID=28034 RepID=UPI0006B541D0|nr:PEP/pyruvate-binding domain-containing protein [Sulfobacillus thermosulfidooxidans]